MNRKFIVYPLFMLLFYILQFIALPLSYKGIAPDYILILMVITGIRENERFAAVVGLCGGLLCDYTSGLSFGLRGILYMLIGWLLAILVSETLSANILTSITSFAVFYIVTRLFFWAEYLVLRGSFKPVTMLFTVTLPEAVMTLPLVPVVYGVLYLLMRNNPRDDRRSGRER